MTTRIKSLDSEGKKRPKMETEFLFLQIGENLLELPRGKGVVQRGGCDKGEETTDGTTLEETGRSAEEHGFDLGNEKGAFCSHSRGSDANLSNGSDKKLLNAGDRSQG